MAGREGHVAQHPHHRRPQVHPASSDHPSPEHGTRSAATSSCCAAPRPARSGRPSKALTLRAGPRAGRTRERVDDGHLRAGVAAHRAPHRGAAGVDLEPRRPERSARHRPAVPPHIHGVALGSRRRRHQDPQLPPHPRAARLAASMHCSSNASGRDVPAAGRRRTLDRHRSRVRLRSGTPLDAANVRRGFRRVATAAGLDAANWTPRELRHSFVSLLSDKGVPHRADRPPRRAHRRVDGHRDRLPQATAPGHQRRRRGNERAVPPRR